MQNAVKIINELENLDRDERMIYSQLASAFDELTPAALHMDFYELANGFSNRDNIERKANGLEPFHGVPHTTPDQWEAFLDIPEIYRYRMAKIAKLQEYDATKAMKALLGQGLSGGTSAVSALKEVAALSKQLASSNGKRERVILTYVPPKRREANA